MSATLSCFIALVACLSYAHAFLKSDRKICVEGKLECSADETKVHGSTLRLVDADWEVFGAASGFTEGDAFPHQNGDFYLCGTDSEWAATSGNDHVFEVVTKCGYTGIKDGCAHRIRLNVDNTNAPWNEERGAYYKHFETIDMSNLGEEANSNHEYCDAFLDRLGDAIGQMISFGKTAAVAAGEIAMGAGDLVKSIYGMAHAVNQTRETMAELNPLGKK